MTPSGTRTLRKALSTTASGFVDLRGLVNLLGRAKIALAAAGQAGEDRDPCHLRPYDPEWPHQYLRLRDQLAAALGEVAVRIDHVGSTSVPGLTARPIIDVQVSVADLDAEEEYRPVLEALGYRLACRETSRRFFHRPHTAHVYVCAAGRAWEYDHLLFVAYLRAHPDRRDAYARLKQSLAAEYGTGSDLYHKLKSPFVYATIVHAEPWAG
ncbi:hypothetical protein C3Y87_14470 [Carbonactinospora thermoautotrophica]|nr:hypothetical protein [Carbonactinospora thermoautotrophica]